MRILVSAYRGAFLKNYDTVVKELADRGHEVEILVEEPWRHINGQDDVLDELRSYSDAVTIREAPLMAEERWRAAALELRSARDHLEFLDPRYPGRYRLRSDKRAPRPLRWLAATGLTLSARVRRWLTALLERLEEAIPPSPELTALLRDRRPDVLILTPFVFLRNPQPELLRAAQALGVPNAVAVYSWDNLSSKAIVRPIPDRLFVWNEIQRTEAVTRHAIPSERVVVTGAQCYDDLFDRAPRTYTDHCTRVGLDPSRPFIVYGCCAPWTFRPETDFVFRWIERVRASGGPLADIGILIRPHPKRPENWATADVSRWENVVVHPREAELPTGGGPKDDHLDALAHCSAVVGINTSLMLEAAIRDKPVLTILDPEFAEAQEGTIHFHYLLADAGGPLTVARDLDEHVDQLAAILADPSSAADRARAFATRFMRPRGIDVQATGVFATAVEELAVASSPARQPLLADAPLRLVLRVAITVYDALRRARHARRSAVSSG